MKAYKKIDKELKWENIFNDTIQGGSHIQDSSNVDGGSNIKSGLFIYGGSYIWGGLYIFGGTDLTCCSEIRGGSNLWGCSDCEGISRCIFCLNFTGKLAIFNKKISEKRFYEVKNRLDSFNWFLSFNNLKDLKSDNKWKCAWADMPQEMLDYIKSLPEFDAQIFKKITGKELE